MLDNLDISVLAGISAVLLCLFWGGAGFWLGRRSKKDAPPSAELERLRDENWVLRDEAVARKKAEAAGEAKSRFLATMAHEIRTPLNGILGLADLLGATELSAEQTSYIASIRQSGTALNALVHEILDLSRIEAGHLTLNPELMSITALVESVGELLAPRAMEKGLEIATFVSNKLPERVVFDAARVRQVLINLAGNAVKFTERGGVGIRAELADEGLIRFSVNDTGPGISPADRVRIFREFETGEKDLTRVEAGAGLGLAISQRLVSGMGGSLNLEEGDGPGAQFSFTLPFEVDAALLPSHEKKARKSILIVAQSHFEAPYLQRRLLESGNDVTLEREPGQIAELLRNQHFDAVLIDGGLGEVEASHISGLAQRFNAGRSLILFSPYERARFNQKIGTQFDGWLVKPVRTQSLLTHLWPQSEAAIVPQLVHSEPQPTKAALRVLLAEDDDVNALVSRKVLESLGATVTLVRNGTDALQALSTAESRGQYDLALVDIRMPGRSGLDVARELRSLEAHQGLRPMRLVAASANSLDADRQAALKAGFDAYLHKPLALGDMREVLAKYFDTGERAA